MERINRWGMQQILEKLGLKLRLVERINRWGMQQILKKHGLKSSCLSWKKLIVGAGHNFDSFSGIMVCGEIAAV